MQHIYENLSAYSAPDFVLKTVMDENSVLSIHNENGVF